MSQLALSVDEGRVAMQPAAMLSGWARPKKEIKLNWASGLQAAGPVRCFREGREIYGAGTQAEVFFQVVSGVIRTCKFLNDGRRQISSFHVAGDLFGIEVGVHYSLSAEAVCECAVIPYRRRELAARVAHNDILSIQVFTYALWSMTRAQEHSLLLGRRSAVEKVAGFLIEWVECSPNSRVISLEMTRQDIGDYLGLTLETVSRTLGHLERVCLIELLTAREIRIKDAAALRSLSL
jgi:CRP/FNR family transcriptional regulator, nitrogen fixation regulation protein